MIDVKMSRDVSAFLHRALVARDPDDDIFVMVWHRDNEDSLVLVGWERLATLMSKVESERVYSSEEPAKLDHLAARPMNELIDLGPNTAHMNQEPTNPFRPGDRIVRANDANPSVGVVEVLPPEKEANPFGGEIEGEAVRVAFPSSLDEGPGDWRTVDPALLVSYCDDQDISLYTYKHTNLEHANQPLRFLPNCVQFHNRLLNRQHASRLMNNLRQTSDAPTLLVGEETFSLKGGRRQVNSNHISLVGRIVDPQGAS